MADESTSTEPKKRGRKKVYESDKTYHEGAPRLATRVAPDVLEWIEAQPEGKRLFIEQLVREHRDTITHGGK